MFVASSINASISVDVVIPCIEKDLEILNACIDGAKKYVNGVRRIIVVSPKELTKNAEWFDEANFPFTLADVGMELGGIGIGDHERRGWYLQQLLKFYAPFIIPGISENVLILDSDTIFLQPYEPILPDGKIQINISYLSNVYKSYVNHMKKMHPSFALTNNKINPVVHHMLFQKSKLERLFNMVENYHKKSFWIAFLHCVNLENRSLKSNSYNFYVGASEYVIYFNFLSLFYSDELFIHKSKILNEMRSLDDIEEAIKKGYEIASCHYYMRK